MRRSVMKMKESSANGKSLLMKDDVILTKYLAVRVGELDMSKRLIKTKIRPAFIKKFTTIRGVSLNGTRNIP